jgi:hypothetical protein
MLVEINLEAQNGVHAEFQW